jgi:DNA-binding HxlR family transcriptional regulator
MTRTHAALQLLALGPLQFREFREITGWPPRVCTGTLSHLSLWGRVVREGRVWRLA